MNIHHDHVAYILAALVMLVIVCSLLTAAVAVGYSFGHCYGFGDAYDLAVEWSPKNGCTVEISGVRGIPAYSLGKL